MPSPILTVADARKRARGVLPRALFDYIDGGADGEVTLAANERAFREVALRPRMGVDPEVDLTTTVLGRELAMPVLLAPAGMVQLVHPDGAVGVARAAAAAGTLAVLSKIALCSPEELAANAPGPHWFQLNSAGGREEVKRLITRARDAGFDGLVVTMDGPPPGNHERDLRHGVVPPVRPRPALAARFAGQLLASPRWAAAMALAARKQKATVQGATRVLGSGGLHRSARFTWADIAWMRAEWDGSLLVKGVLVGADAIAARDAGADAVIVSNHGGRALDGAPATLTVLPEIVAAVGDTTEVLLDGGVRRAADVVKALCLGARAVLIGRPFVYGLAAAGQPGVEQVLSVFQTELVRVMRLVGCASPAELDTGMTQAMHPWTESK
ncbi:alpha-hydroxy acid oxidase [Actinomadura sp. NEAU-AAG7]|uniref:alpha-hydroxy acid oxidase n=1 Tax=Actinomadura sp. NEAU-AAG7 TaxID=2839640 RepID=UPI001BE4A066|nr:alpha-hydroxy acid oxidase [Actinomadura sp. NEAU-AAG7]MBT2212871.1 alpha-hydroxy-acid oxidizing protein [Actinomadura sp. NEAU-AAG7]